MALNVAGFEWDEGNLDKCKKHGVTLAVVESLFQRALAVFPDPAHSEAEERFKAIGRSAGGRYVFVVFTVRRRDGETLIRPISARYMHRKEVEHYAKEIAQAAQRSGG